MGTYKEMIRSQSVKISHIAMRFRLFAQNPNASAEELKQFLLAETISVDVTVEDLYYDEAAGSLSDESPYISYSEIMTVNILPAR